MHRLLISSVVAAVLFVAGRDAANAEKVISIRTAQTIVQLDAGAAAPQLLSVRAPGQVAWLNEVAETLIANAEVDGRSVPLRWKLAPGGKHVEATHVTFVYETDSPHLRLTWEWSAPASIGPLEHRIRIENLDTRKIWIPLQPSFCYGFRVPRVEDLEQVYVDKGAGKPSPVGLHERVVALGSSWEGQSSTYATDGEPREIIPWFMVGRENGKDMDGWYAGIEFSGRTSLALHRSANLVSGTLGLNPNPGAFRTRLQPQETFEAPTAFVGAFTGDQDNLGNVLRPWIREVLTYASTWRKPNYPLLTNNSWGSGMAVDEDLAKRMINDSAELGMEMFHIDAGWFRGVGDWCADPKKFPHGLAAVADDAHRHGLKLGIWVNWAQAGVDNEPDALNVSDPTTKNWLVADTPAGWKPDGFVGRTTDIGLDAAREHAQRELERMITSYKLDMIEHDGYLVARNCSRSDHPHAPPAPGTISTINGSGIAMPDTSNSTDVSYHAVKSYYAIYSHLRKEHPDLLFEICNDGGRMVDFGSASHGDYFSITDSYDPLSNRQAFFDASHLLPAAMLEAYVEKWPTPRLETFRYMLRSGMMGWLTVMQDTNAWTREEHAAAKQEFALYKEKLRPFIRDADLYHISDRPDGVHWDGIEYNDTRRGQSVVYAFRGSMQAEAEHTFSLRGLNPERKYRLHFQDGSAPDRVEHGTRLLRDGLEVALPFPNSAELIFLEEMK